MIHALCHLTPLKFRYAFRLASPLHNPLKLLKTFHPKLPCTSHTSVPSLEPRTTDYPNLNHLFSANKLNFIGAMCSMKIALLEINKIYLTVKDKFNFHTPFIKRLWHNNG